MKFVNQEKNPSYFCVTWLLTYLFPRLPADLKFKLFQDKILFSVNGVWYYFILFLEIIGIQHFGLQINFRFLNWYWYENTNLNTIWPWQKWVFGLIWLFGLLNSCLLSCIVEGWFIYLSTICCINSWHVSRTC